MDPNVVATIESVGPTQSVGTYRILGMGIRSFSPSAGHTTLIGVEGYPAKVPDVLATPSGYVVRTACSHDPSAPTTELLVGFGLEGSDGGGWLGIDVTYSASGVRRILHLDHDLLVCGPLVESRCGGPPFTTAPPPS